MRHLKKIFIVILILILFLFACINFITVKPIRQTFDQRLKSFPVKNMPLADSATVYWDEHLIPFIEAQNDADCAFLLGTVHAHLRLGQMVIHCLQPLIC